MFKFEKIFKTDVTLTIIVLLLSITGLMNIFATTYYPDLEPSQLFWNQMLYVFLGFVVYFLITIFDYKKLSSIYVTLFIYLATIGLLIAVLIFGIEIYGAKRWISIGSFLLQPSEFAKLSIVLIFAYVYRNKENTRKINTISSKLEKPRTSLINTQLGKLLAVGTVWLSFAVLIMQQNSLGNTILLSGILTLLFLCIFKLNLNTSSYIGIGFFWFLAGFEILTIKTSGNLYLETKHINIDFILVSILLIISIYILLKIRLHFFFVFGIIVLCFGSKLLLDYGYNEVLEDYQRGRIESFVNPTNELSQNANWNRDQSLIAIGSSTVLGKGFLNGTQSNYKFLPFSYTDFAYASYIEQFGSFGAIFLLGLYFAFCARLILITGLLKNNYEKLIVYGGVFLVLLNTIQHVGMNLGLLPITGVPLPLVSYGGSSTLVIFIALGLINSIFTDDTNKFAKIIKINPKPKDIFYKRIRK